MLDDIGLKILKILQKKARIPNVEVARQVKMAPSAVLERIRKLERQGERLSDENREALLAAIRSRYDEHASPYYAAARLWVDEIIDPVETRAFLSRGLAMANCRPVADRFNPGVLQT